MSRKYHQHSNTRKISTYAPTTRMVLLHVWAYTNESGVYEAGHEVLPVVGIVSQSGIRYYKDSGDNSLPDTSPSHREMLKLGWYADKTAETLSHDVLVVNPEYGEIVAGEDVASSNSVTSVVTCPWPPADDEVKLAPFLADLGEEAISDAQHKEKT